MSDRLGSLSVRLDGDDICPNHIFIEPDGTLRLLTPPKDYGADTWKLTVRCAPQDEGEKHDE